MLRSAQNSLSEARSKRSKLEDKEHVSPLPAIIQFIKGEAKLTVEEEVVIGKLGPWIQMTAKTPHSIEVQTPLVMLLTLLK